jgi:hypothetical protein
MANQGPLPIWADPSQSVDLSDESMRRYGWLPEGLECKPMHADGAVGVQQGADLLLRGPHSPRAIVVDPVSALLWSWMDGQSSIAELGELLATVPGVADEPEPAFLAQALTAGLVRVLAENALLAPPLDVLALPNALMALPEPDS